MSTVASCRNHPAREAVGICVSCRTQICIECVTRIDGINYCVTCLATLDAPREAKSIVVGPSRAGEITRALFSGVFLTLAVWGLVELAAAVVR